MMSVECQTTGAGVGMECHGGGELRGDLAVRPSLAGIIIGVVELLIFVGGVCVGCVGGEGVLGCGGVGYAFFGGGRGHLFRIESVCDQMRK
jgi:hypothetical protein